MNVIMDRPTKCGKKRRVVVEVDQDENLMSFFDDRHYKLGEPLDEVVPGHIITGAMFTTWCPIEQKWVT